MPLLLKGRGILNSSRDIKYNKFLGKGGETVGH